MKSGYAAKLIFASTSCALMLANPAKTADDFSIQVNNSDIAVQANNASLKDVMQELERLTGIDVAFTATSDERVTVNVGMTNLENAINKISPNHLLVHEKVDGKNVIKELIIIPAESDLVGDSSGSAFLPNGEPAQATQPTTAPEPTLATDQPQNDTKVQPQVAPDSNQATPTQNN